MPNPQDDKRRDVVGLIVRFADVTARELPPEDRWSALMEAGDTIFSQGESGQFESKKLAEDKEAELWLR